MYLSNHLQKFWEYFNSILTSYCTASVKHCMLFLLTLKKTCLTIYVYIWLPRNSTCILKYKQTWPEQAIYNFIITLIIIFIFITFTTIRSSRLQMFYNIGVLKIFSYFNRKVSALEFLFNKVADLKPATLIKGDSNTGVFLWNLQNF